MAHCNEEMFHVFHGPRRTSRQLRNKINSCRDADPMTLLAFREQKMCGFAPVCLSVVTLFGPLFDYDANPIPFKPLRNVLFCF
jgi:hypothetical protein